MSEKFITLTTDYGNGSFYTSILKGELYSNIENLHIIDITHDIPLFNRPIAAFTIKNCYKHFPKGTIHIIDVFGEYSNNYTYLLLKYNGYYFLSADNGIFSLVFDNDEKIDDIYKINLTQDQIDSNFKTKDILLKIAIKIANNKNIKNDVTKVEEFTTAFNYINPPIINNNRTLIGSVIYVDNYENAIINITKEEFFEFTKDRKFVITWGSTTSTSKVSIHYFDEENMQSDIKILFGTTHNFMEISLASTGAASLLGLKLNTQILVNLID